MIIRCSNPKAQYLSHKEEIDAAVRSVLDSGWYILGTNVEEFEKEFASFVGVSHGIGVGNGTDAIQLALASCGVGIGDEVITVSHTVSASIAAIDSVGAIPVLADIEPDTFTINVNAIEELITPKTKAIIPVHIYGHPVDLPSLLDIAKKNNLFVIEDCAQAHGASINGKRVGSFGDMACFSFYPTKNLGAMGDGGMVMTHCGQLAEKARLLREYGWAERYISHFKGWNTRLDELQAAILRVKLKYLNDSNLKRNEIAQLYLSELKNMDITLPVTAKKAYHVYHLFVIRVKDRDHLASYLKERGIGTAIHYPQPIHLQPAYIGRSIYKNLEWTTGIAKEILSLPIYPELELKDVKAVCLSINEYYKEFHD